MAFSAATATATAVAAARLLLSLGFILVLCFVWDRVSGAALNTNNLCNCKNQNVPFFRIFYSGDDNWSEANDYDDGNTLCGHIGRVASIRSQAEYDCMEASIDTSSSVDAFWLNARQNSDMTPYTWRCPDNACDHNGETIPFIPFALSPFET